MSTTTFTDEEFFESESQLAAIFGLEAPGTPRAEDTLLTAEHGERIDRIIDEALHEAVVRDTATFFFKTFGVGLSGLAGTLFSALDDLATGAQEGAGQASSGVDPGTAPPDDA